MKRIRVLIVDDSAIVRQGIRALLSAEADIEVVGDAPDPYVARDRLLELKPDVLTLDLEMPRMDGLTFLGRLMAHHPIPVVVVSSLTPEGSEMALAALDAGAVEVVSKGSSAVRANELGPKLSAAIRTASRARVFPRVAQRSQGPVACRTTARILALGASTGGTVALERVLKALPAHVPGTVIVQHLPPGFTSQFARRLDAELPFEVREASDGDAVVPGRVLIAPGEMQMSLLRDGARYAVRVVRGERVNHHAPSVDVLFHSVAKACGPDARGVILTGMGDDGARGLLAMRQAGARTFAQDRESSVVWGMPRVAAELGAAERVLPLDGVAAALVG